MRVKVNFPAQAEKNSVELNVDSLDSLKSELWNQEGVPPQYQNYKHNGESIADNEAFEKITCENSSEAVDLEFELTGLTGGSSAGVETGKFMIYCRFSVGFCGCDDKWNKCQCCCVYAKCNIS